MQVAVTVFGQNLLSYIRVNAPFWKPFEESVCDKGKQHSKNVKINFIYIKIKF